MTLRIGCVENSVSGSAMRPLDVLRTRSGKPWKWAIPMPKDVSFFVIFSPTQWLKGQISFLTLLP